MDIKAVLSQYDSFREKRLKDRFFKHKDIIELLKDLPSSFRVRELGTSVNGLSINLVSWGNGATKVMLWSQMHGDEATGTMALFDLFKFLSSNDALVTLLQKECKLFFIPMVNPDGAGIFTRRNIQQIDINRDYLQTVTPEAKILKQCREDINPQFGFNLHDQITLWSVSGSLKPATLSFLAPSFDEKLNINETREKAMLVIADMFEAIHPLITGHIGLFKDEYEPRAFGDNFQAAGTSTILIEAGGFKDDFEKQEIRKFYFGAMLSGLASIASGKYKQQDLAQYFEIPQNNKQIFHILINNVVLNGINISVGLNYEECPTADGSGAFKTYHIEDIGDLSICDAYEKFDASDAELIGTMTVFKNAHFVIRNQLRQILAFENGNRCWDPKQSYH